MRCLFVRVSFINRRRLKMISDRARERARERRVKACHTIIELVLCEHVVIVGSS